VPHTYVGKGFESMTRACAVSLVLGLFLAAGCGGTKCPATSTECAGVCIDTQHDPTNCGACGNACLSGQACSLGVCLTACQAGLERCSGACSDLATDTLNCGACGHVCPLGQQCADGACACPTATPDACGTGESAFCTAFNTDPLHCGDCDTACDPGQMCSANGCVETCANGFDACPDPGPATYCADLTNDARNCGACGHVCPRGKQCVADTCVCPTTTPDACGTGEGAFCTNFDTDPLHCGGCGNACGAGQVCSPTGCVETCATGFAACPDPGPATYCADLSDDARNCGTCGHVCPLGQQCVSNTCVCPTATPDACGTGSNAFCTDFTADPLHCGDCDTACDPGQVCSPTGCVETCATGFAACPDPGPATYCADLSDDARNCGTCGHVCPFGQQCVNNDCVCPTATPDACGTGPNALCTSFATDPDNCGSCGNPCSLGRACIAGECHYETMCVGNTITLDPAWSGNFDFNFHPQGMTYDAAADRLVLALQDWDHALRVIGLDGVLQSTITLNASGSNAFTYMTSVAADANYYYVTDYTCNSGCPDLFRVAKTGGTPTQISTGIAAYGGYPITIGNGELYRGEDSTSYDWTAIDQIRVSAVATPDTVTRTLSTGITRGIGDLTWDGEWLWALAYATTANRTVDLFRIDPATGIVLAQFPAVYTAPANFVPSGLAYAKGRLYVLNYSETTGVGSTLTVLGCD
jgi:hypothetical protein